MTVSKAQKAATAKYEAKAYDKILVRLSRGKKDTIQSHAEARGESVNGFINRAITETMERDKDTQERELRQMSGTGAAEDCSE